MKKLSLHYQQAQDLYPEDRMMILFDIDGTILDMRYTILYVLQSFDNQHDTRFFKGLNIADIAIHETEVDALLEKVEIPLSYRSDIIDWYEKQFWSTGALLEAHRPFAGVMEVIRWFQMQPNTYVGLNTGRPESMRTDTLRSLNRIGEEYKVEFSNSLLYMMNPYGKDREITTSKVAGILHFQKSGYRIFAYIDNEPENLKAISELDPRKQILLLHANTLFKSKRRKLPSRAVSGKQYDLTELIDEKKLPQHVQFVWHGVNDEGNLRQFLTSNIRWAECDVRLDPKGENVVLRDDSFASLPPQEDEELLKLGNIINTLKGSKKSIKLDLKENNLLIDKILSIIRNVSLEGENLWFNGKIEVLKESGFRKLASAYPLAIIQCPIDSLVPLIQSVPGKALAILDMFRDWGINRFSISWKNTDIRQTLDKLDKWGFEANIYNVPDLESFLRAILLLPRSITSDFNFPKWQYYGRGSGQNQKRHVYSITNISHSLSPS